MLRPKIEEVTIHPLDPIQESNSLLRYLGSWNSKLFSSENYSEGEVLLSSYRIRSVKSINLKTFLFFSVYSRFSNKPILIVAQDAHSITDYIVEKYKSCVSHYFSSLDLLINSGKGKHDLIIHYRQGAGGFAVHSGQNIPRQMPIDSVINAIKHSFISSHKKVSRIRLFTDSPAATFMYTPPPNQIYLWKDMPGFDGSVVTNVSSEIDHLLAPIATELGLPLVVDRHLGAFEMIFDMATAPVLIISRSSLSYLGGLFNSNGKVYYPKGFWHTKLQGWETYGYDV
jgi:hypothetical protein